MSYYFAQTLQSSFDDAVANTTTALEEGFGIITDDRRESAQAQARRRFPPLQNPWGVQSKLADEALKLEDKVGTMFRSRGRRRDGQVLENEIEGPLPD